MLLMNVAAPLVPVVVRVIGFWNDGVSFWESSLYHTPDFFMKYGRLSTGFTCNAPINGLTAFAYCQSVNGLTGNQQILSILKPPSISDVPLN